MIIDKTIMNIPTSDGFNLQGQITAHVTIPVFDRGYCVNSGMGWLTKPEFTGKSIIADCRKAGMKVLVNYHRYVATDPSATFVVDLGPIGIDAITEVSFRGSFHVNVVALTEEDCEKVIKLFLTMFPKWRAPRKKEDPKSHVNFWMMTPNGPAPTTRLLDVTTWADIKQNYPEKAQGALSDLINYRADKSGQIVMLHGAPGTGKTFLLRALAWEWQPWCTMHYVMDADQLLNGSPFYMTELLFSQNGPDGRNVLVGGVDEDEDEEYDGTPKKPRVTLADTPEFTTKPVLFGGDRWRLIILEDTGELLTTDAAHRTGQGLGRLLNAADGMLGQGSRVLFLITTNEPLEKIHPAVARPGRALANIHFDPFTRNEAACWVERNGGKPEAVKKDMTLAEMYSLVGGTPGTKQVTTQTELKDFGFSGKGRTS